MIGSLEFGQDIMRHFLKRFIITCAVVLAFGSESWAQGYIPILRDAEGEAMLDTLLHPLAQAAGLEPDAVHPRLVDHASVNAFVSYGQDVYVHSGVILALDDVAQVQGILAHEIGHVAGGHAVRRDFAKKRSRNILAGHMLLGAGILAADLADNEVDALGGAITAVGAGFQMQANYMAAYDRKQEYAADQAAVTYLLRAKLPLDGLVKVFERTLTPENDRSAYALQLYARSHPDMSDRIRALKGRISTEVQDEAENSVAETRFALFKAKMLGQVYGVEAVRGRYSEAAGSMNARYALANAHYADGQFEDALRLMDELVKDENASAYFHELRGNILIRLGRANEAIGPLEKANALAPNTPLLMIQESAARLNAASDPDAARSALARLEAATVLDREIVAGWHLLGLAHHRLGNEGGMRLALAHKHMLLGDTAAARHYAHLAHTSLPFGSPSWLDAEHLLSVVGN